MGATGKITCPSGGLGERMKLCPCQQWGQLSGDASFALFSGRQGVGGCRLKLRVGLGGADFPETRGARLCSLAEDPGVWRQRLTTKNGRETSADREVPACASVSVCASCGHVHPAGCARVWTCVNMCVGL